MIDKDFETFVYISFEKILICIFSKKNSKILYMDECKSLEANNQISKNRIVDFLNSNIFKIEKQLNSLIYDLNLIINSNQFKSVNLSIKQNINLDEISQKEQINLLNELKNEIKNNYPNYSIIHYIINHYLFDDNIQKHFDISQKCNHLCLDATFIILNKQDIFFYKKIFEKFQISVEKIICGQYIFDILGSNKLNECEMGLKISSGFNPNEVFLIKKSIEKKGFFERFFNFFN